MAHIQRLGEKGNYRYKVRYLDPARKERSKTFQLKGDAERFVTHVSHAIHTGGYVSPNAGKKPFGPYAADWLARQGHLSTTTAERYDQLRRGHLARWDEVSLSRITASSIQKWLAALTYTPPSGKGQPAKASRPAAPATKIKTYRLLSMILDAAVADGELRANPAKGIKLAPPTKHDPRFLTLEQAITVAGRCGKYWVDGDEVYGYHRMLVLFLIHTGLRWGEVTGLRVSDVDFLRRRVRINENTVRVKGGTERKAPKSGKFRTVPLGRAMTAELARHVQGRQLDDWLFPGQRRGGPITLGTFTSALKAAAAGVADDLHPHELRHTAASLAIAEGANPKVVQMMLGHADIGITLNLYGHLFPDQLDDVADRMDAAYVTALEKTRPAPSSEHASSE